MNAKRFYFLWILTATFVCAISESKVCRSCLSFNSSDFVDKCSEMQETDIRFTLSKKVRYARYSLRVISNDSVACYVNHGLHSIFPDNATIGPVWINLPKSGKTGNYLGNKEHFTARFRRNCIALLVRNISGNITGEWVNRDCTEKLPALCDSTIISGPRRCHQHLSFNSSRDFVDKCPEIQKSDIRFTLGKEVKYRHARHYLGVISSDSVACYVNHGLHSIFPDKATIGPVWIKLPKSRKPRLYLGNKVNFTARFKKNCIALQVRNISGNITGEWVNRDCSDQLPALRSDSSEKFKSNDAIFPDYLYLERENCSFIKELREQVINFENDLNSFVRKQTQDCEAHDNKTRVLSQMMSLCDDKDLNLNSFNASCPNASSDHTLAIAEIPLYMDLFAKFVKRSSLNYNWNKKKTKLPPHSRTLMSFSILGPGNETDTDTSVTFYYDLKAMGTLVDNAFNLTFDNRDDSLLATTYRIQRYSPQCAFIDPSTGEFDTYGCDCTEEEGGGAKCTSNHTTLFAVLLDVDSVEVPSSIKILSMSTQSISVFFLALSFWILIRVRKKVRGDRIAVQINLVVALFFLHFWTLLQDVALHFPLLCCAVAGFTHFFLLSSALWMTNEAILLFLKTSRWAFVQAKRRKVVIATMVFGWGIAALVTTMTAAIGYSRDSYMKYSVVAAGDNVTEWENVAEGEVVPQYDYCWLAADTGIRWSVIGPVLVLLIFNLAVAIKVAVFVYQKRDEAKNFKPAENVANQHGLDMDYLNSLSASLKAFTILMPALGVPWLLLLLSNINEDTTKLAFMYVNVILNGLQGVFIFIVYCVVTKEVRDSALKSFAPLTNTWNSIIVSLEKRREKVEPLCDSSPIQQLPLENLCRSKVSFETEPSEQQHSN